jgi:hypothetical protein
MSPSLPGLDPAKSSGVEVSSTGTLEGSAATTRPRVEGAEGMRIRLTGVFVDDQAKALKFYTERLGFEKKLDFPTGKYRWLTVVSPEEPDGVNLVLEPNDNQAPGSTKKRFTIRGSPPRTSSSRTSRGR